jgi:hypothetical protein
MKPLPVLLLPLALPLLAAEPGLPVWDEGEKARLEENGWIAGGLLLTEEPVPEEKTEEPAQSLNVARPTPEEIAEAAIPPDEIPEKFLPVYFDQRPKSFLVDPQGLLGQVDYRDRLGFLNYHAGDSSIDLYVYLFKGEQDIPGEVREEELMERFFSEGRPAAVVFYYLGAPQRSVLYLSPSLTDMVSAAEQRRALESSVMQSFGKTEPAAQIESFLVQMSIRLYWMERMMNGEPAPEAENSPVARAKAAARTASSKWELLQPVAAKLKPHAIPAAALLGTALAALAALTWMRRRARHLFPEFDVEPRLGGAHAAGVGAVISFASAAIPPASQRDQVPDYLRRM